jgi:hypothetical protein
MQLQTKLFHTNVDDALLDMSAAEKGRKRSINNFIIIKLYELRAFFVNA